MRETQQTIRRWAEETFGPLDLPPVGAARANKEMAELIAALAKDPWHPGAVEECADVAIVLFRLVDQLGGDLLAEVDRKMQINRARRWVPSTDGTGTFLHLKDGAA